MTAAVYAESTVLILANDLREGDMLATDEGRVVAQVRGLGHYIVSAWKRTEVRFDMVDLEGVVRMRCDGAPDTSLFRVVGSEER